MMKYKLLAAAAVGALTFSSAAFAADCPIKLGGMAPLSAPGTVVGGEAMRDAMLIAEEDINAAGGVSIDADWALAISSVSVEPECRSSTNTANGRLLLAATPTAAR